MSLAIRPAASRGITETPRHFIRGRGVSLGAIRRAEIELIWPSLIRNLGGRALGVVCFDVCSRPPGLEALQLHSDFKPFGL